MTETKYKKSTIISKGSDKPKSKKSTHYVSNPDLYESFVEWYSAMENAEKDGLPEPRMPDKIGLAFLQIAENLAKKSNWLSNTKWKEEMVGNAIISCVKYAKSFNPKVSTNPFSYFTQTCYYSFLHTIRLEKKQDYVKHKSMMNTMMNNNLMEMIGDDELEVEAMDYNVEGIAEFIKNFEVSNFGEELSTDSVAGMAGRRKQIKQQDSPEENMGFF